jgi:methionyl-tRNA formyltransferase
VIAVVTQPDRPAGRGQKLVATPVKRAADARDLRVFTPEKLRPFAEEARGLGPEAFVVASYGKIVPQMLLDLVPVAFNVHPSLLPLYRGATPLQSAIRDGRRETGVTIIAMDAGMDTGDVLLQERTPIGVEETYGELHDRLARRGAEMAVEALGRYADGTLERRPQHQVAAQLGIDDEDIARTLTRPLRKDDLAIDWSRPARAIVDQVRSLAPQPLARAALFGEPLKIERAHAVDLAHLASELGGIVSAPGEPQLVVGGARGHYRTYGMTPRGDEAVVVDRLIAPNRGSMTGEAYAQAALQRFGRTLG